MEQVDIPIRLLANLQRRLQVGMVKEAWMVLLAIDAVVCLGEVELLPILARPNLEPDPCRLWLLDLEAIDLVNGHQGLG